MESSHEVSPSGVVPDSPVGTVDLGMGIVSTVLTVAGSSVNDKSWTPPNHVIQVQAVKAGVTTITGVLMGRSDGFLH